MIGRGRNPIDLTGKRFGRIVALQDVGAERMVVAGSLLAIVEITPSFALAIFVRVTQQAVGVASVRPRQMPA